MIETVRIILAQQNFCVGDIAGNCEKIIKACEQARSDLQGDLVVFPELALCGYPPEDLLFREDFHEAITKALDTIQKSVKGIGLILGFPHKTAEGIYNAAVYFPQDGEPSYYSKRKLPNYGVFDEKRYFLPGNKPVIITVKNLKIGLTICEDLWFKEPSQDAVKAGARVLISLNASPYDIHKESQRLSVLKDRISENNVPIIYAHSVGAQDELVFDGASFALDAEGKLCAQAPSFQELLFPLDVSFDNKSLSITGALSPKENFHATVYKALTLGLKDYVHKNGFKGALVGLSGGVDSALVLTLAVDALGKENVHAVLMPSQYTSELSNELAITLANNLGVRYDILPIDEPFQAFLKPLQQIFHSSATDLTQQNIQARARGIFLMALSNKEGKLLLTTGNKSEMAVGYATLYGDMAGGLAVIKDVYKTLVYKLCEYKNRHKEIIPQTILTRAPTAELAPNQKDQDTLPPYDILDSILERYIESDEGIEDMVKAGFDRETIKKVMIMVDKAEYKRRQSPPGIRITTRAFGKERRYPITSRFLNRL